MTGVAALERIERCQTELLSALDSGDIRAIEAGTAALRDAVEEAPADWICTPETERMARRVAELAHSAQIRVNFLTDMIRRRLERLSVARGRGPCATYGAAGR